MKQTIISKKTKPSSKKKTPSSGEHNDLLALSKLTNQLYKEISWLEAIVRKRIEALSSKSETAAISITAPEVLSGFNDPYSDLINEHQLKVAERLTLACCIATQLKPSLLSSLLVNQDNPIKPQFAEFGGYIDRIFFHFIPSLETILYLLAGVDELKTLEYQLEIQNSALVKEGILTFSHVQISPNDDHRIFHIPNISAEYLNYFQTGTKPRPDFGRSFPAEWVTTSLSWDQLVIDKKTETEIQKIERWINYGHKLTGLSDQINPSFSCLFYGPPGTGKSLTATLLGKKHGKDVFRVDLSMIVSKYIGETEKNLAFLFDKAENKDWILFFDEADALFSKRTEVKDSNDKWANLEMSYLLQRMESYKGVTILATNLKENIDVAMTRRFQCMAYFPYPKQEQRKILWAGLIPEPFRYSDDISLDKLAKFELSGANISNILKQTCLISVEKDISILEPYSLQENIKQELIKEKRTP